MSYRLLLVDDEIHLVESLAETINWRAHGIEAVFQAGSGAEAIELMRTNEIDIVVTDIRMPGMNGLELIRKIRRYWPKTRCVILTGHSDFEYARAAIHTQTVDYLLKPVGDEEVTDVIDRITQELREAYSELVYRQKAQHALREHLPLLRGNLLGKLLQGARMSHADLHSKLEQYDLHVRAGDPVQLLLIRLDQAFDHFSESDRQLMEFAIGNMAQEWLAAGKEIWYTKDLHEYLVFLLPAGEALPTHTASLQASVRRYLQGGISVAVGEIGQFPDDIPLLYRKGITQFRRKIGEGQQVIYAPGEAEPGLQEEGGHVYPLARLYEPPALLHVLEAGRWGAACEKLEELFAELEQQGQLLHEYVTECHALIMHAFCCICHRNGRLISEVVGENDNLAASGGRFRTLRQLRAWAMNGLAAIQADLDSDVADTKLSVVSRVRAYIEAHLHTDVSLQTLADHVQLHPVYLSKLYKSETREALSDYLLRVRMEKAAYWLKQTDRKIYEITAELGYQNPQYFSKLFRRYFGITPQEFRDT